ncbi:MAG: hypothetical protein ACMG6E_08015 [Candidatus Roizmanbacteria bacterium]
MPRLSVFAAITQNSTEQKNIFVPQEGKKAERAKLRVSQYKIKNGSSQSAT